MALSWRNHYNDKGINMKTFLFLNLLIISSCKTQGGSGVKGLPSQDPLVAEFRDGFCAGKVPTVDVLTSKTWQCVARAAASNNFNAAGYRLSFRQDSENSSRLFAQAEGYPDLMVYNVTANGIIGPHRIPAASGVTVKASYLVAFNQANNKIYIAEEIAKSDAGMPIAKSCDSWNKPSSGFIGLTRCE
jgi:hypothetical protein